MLCNEVIGLYMIENDSTTSTDESKKDLGKLFH